MFDHDVTMELIRRAQQGDEQAKTRLIEENTPLLKSIIRRYVGKGVEYDDLFQISSVGLLKAINNFSLEYNVKFSTYAVPMVLGEVKRFLRDDGYVKVSRSVKTQANKISGWRLIARLIRTSRRWRKSRRSSGWIQAKSFLLWIPRKFPFLCLKKSTIRTTSHFVLWTKFLLRPRTKTL